MKHFSKLAALLLGAAMIFAFAGCANSSDNPPETYTITINESENGSVTASKTTGITAGEKITLTVTPADPDDADFALDTLFVKNGDIYVSVSGSTSSKNFTMPAANVTVSATFTRITYIGTKKPSRAKEVGDLVFNDGSAMPYSDFLAVDKTTKYGMMPIALIFYKGTDLNSDDSDGNADTTTCRTLGVGVDTGFWESWCLKNAAAFNKNITTIQCSRNESAGMLTFTGDKNGSDNLEQIAAFLNAAEGVEDDTATAENYPSFYYGKNYGDNGRWETYLSPDSEFTTGWYLPSIAELYKIYENGVGTNKVFDFEALGNDIYSFRYLLSANRKYISSSQNNNYGYGANKDPTCVCLDFHTGEVDSQYKTNLSFALFIREFN